MQAATRKQTLIFAVKPKGINLLLRNVLMEFHIYFLNFKIIEKRVSVLSLVVM